MIQITAQMRVLVAIEPVDGRKGIDSLVRLCQDKLVRQMSQVSVVDVALDAVANVAMRNSVLMDIRPEPDA